MSTLNVGEYSLINNIQSNLKTNNMIFDILIGLLVGKLISYIFNGNVFVNILFIIKSIRNFDFRQIKGSVVMTFMPTEQNTSCSVMQMINFVLTTKINNIKNIYYNNNGKTLTIKELDKIKFLDDIYVRISSEDIDKKKDDAIINRITIYTITFTSSVHNSNVIEKKIKSWMSEWEKESYKKDIQISNDVETARNFKSFKTFDNLFFDGKDDLIKAINRFRYNIDDYKKIGRPHTLGILLYGEGGCGKTSVLKAISNMTQLDIQTINFKKYSSTEDFNDAWFHSLKLGSWKNDALSEKIIHLPEIDYLCDQFLKEGETNTTKETNTSKETNETEKQIIINVNDKDNNNKNKNDTKNLILNKAFLRELFDGVDEQHGRIIVMTTNNIDRLDPIMIRDGRIDIKIKFEKMTKENTQKYLEYVFSEKITNQDNIPHKKYSAAEVQSIVEKAYTNNKNILECIDMLHNNLIQ